MVSGRWVLAITVLAATRLGAQSAGAQSGVPEGFRPPPGMCRIWIEGVPPERQPAPTDCATAVRKRPSNAHVVFGDLSGDTDPVKPGNPSNANTTAPAAPPPPPATTPAPGQPQPKEPAAKQPAHQEPKPAPAGTFAPRAAPTPLHPAPGNSQGGRPIDRPASARPNTTPPKVPAAKPPMNHRGHGGR
jgi:hypothetical protein